MLNTTNKKIEKIINVFGFNDYWSNEFFEINPKLSIWIADTFLDKMISKHVILSEEDTNLTSKNLLELKRKVARDININKSCFDFSDEDPSWVGNTYFQYLWVNTYKDKYKFIMDWVTNPKIAGHVNITSLSFDEAFQKSDEWHESLDYSSVINYQEKNEIIIDYRDQDGIGYYWCNLNTDYSSEESDRMGHCGRDSGTTLFSLRSVNYYNESKSHITVSYRATENKLEQIKGRKNSKPKNIYHKYIIDLILNDKYKVKGLKKNVYNFAANFSLDDLPQEDLDNLFKNNKDLKFDYLFSDKEILANSYDDTMSLMKENNSTNFGIVNKDSLDIIKKFKYTTEIDSDYTDFLLYEEEVKFVTLKYMKSDVDHFLLCVTPEFVFYLIDEEKADKILKSKTYVETLEILNS